MLDLIWIQDDTVEVEVINTSVVHLFVVWMLTVSIATSVIPEKWVTVNTVLGCLKHISTYLLDHITTDKV